MLGFDNWADYITADKMVGSAAQRLRSSSIASSPHPGRRPKREYRRAAEAQAAGRARRDGRHGVGASYYSELVRKASYDFDSQAVRPYFPFDRVKQGVLDVTSQLFGVTYRPVDGAPVWDPSVEAYEMLEDGKVIGRFYLDMHPREDKYNHAAQFPHSHRRRRAGRSRKRR